MAEKQTPRKSKEEMTCFVVIGFGMKTDHATGRTLNLDLTYTKLIKPAFDNVGIRCFRAIDINVTGSIDKLMYHWIYQADFVIADLSTMNANVFYELGVRHAQKRNTTLLMAENGLFKRLPFDLSHTIIYSYEHLGEDIADDTAEEFVGLLTTQLEKLLADPGEDSPVYTYMPGMDEPKWEDPKKQIEQRNKRIEELEAKLAEQAKIAEQVKSGEKSKLDPNASLSILVDSAEMAKDEKDFPTAIALLKRAIKNFEGTEDEEVEPDIFLRQRLALSTYKNKEKDKDDNVAIAALKEAEQILIDHCELYISTDPETLGLGGAINKRLYERTLNLHVATKDEEYLEESLVYFKRSVHHYERGFYIKQDYYNGINVAYMYTLKAAYHVDNDYDAIVNYGHANLIRIRVAEICLALVKSKHFESRGDKQWIYPTLFEAYFGMDKEEKAKEFIPDIEKYSKGSFDLSSFKDQNAKLIDAMDTFKKKVTIPGGDGAGGQAPEMSDLPALIEKPKLPATAAAPRVHHTPEGSISIDLGSHRGQSVKSIEVNCKIEFE